ncbi:MAG: hypothetical protein NW220_19940 [Leptolyngbyaceae cyanobacterium bins.349]|nr:hypothetical protein [Leptolyngbyaceae cyanobacterium bins.349]
MNLQASLLRPTLTCTTLINTAVMLVAGLGFASAIAAEPPAPQTTEQAAQAVDVCRQAGADYRKLYTIEEANRSITICQKDNQYYHVTTETRTRLVVRYAASVPSGKF